MTEKDKSEIKKTKKMGETRFLDHIYDGYKAGQKYCFILGAGASRTSGIRTGMEMMREWYDYLQNKGTDYIEECATDIGYEKEDYGKLFEEGYKLQSDDYFTVFDLRFAGQPKVAYDYLEKEMVEKYPSYGYFPLAMFLENTENRVVITTNFDTLLEDALYTYTLKHPLVVGHESLAPYILTDNTHPIIAKIHRDLLFSPFNRKQDMEKLKEEWEKPLKNILSQYIPIVIGYAGGDHTLMSLLQDMELEKIYWCYVGKEPDENIQSLVEKQNGYFVKILGFDEVMFQLGERFSEEAKFGDACEYIKEQANKRCNLYQKSFDEIKEKYDTVKRESAESLHPEASTENVTGMVNAIERYDSRNLGSQAVDEETRKLVKEAQIKYLKGEHKEAIELYTKAINKNPQTAIYYKRRSDVLYRMGRYEEGLQDDTKAIELAPSKAEYYDSRSTTLHKMGRYEEALEDSIKAIELDGSNAEYYSGRGIILHKMGRYEEALKDKIRAIELDGSKAKYYDSRCITLYKMGRYEEALEDSTKAIELEGSNARCYNQRAVTLHEMGRYEEALEDRTKAIELEGSNSRYYAQRAVTLHEMGRYEEALEDDTKAIELDSSNAEYYNSRAMTLRKLNREEEALADEAKAKELEKTT